MIPTEHQEQAAFVRWFRIEFPAVRLFAIPNGAFLAGSIGQRAAQMRKLKAEGLDTGVPDICIPAWDFWIEFKRIKGGVVSDEQREWHQYLRDLGDTVIVAKGADDAMQQVRSWRAKNARTA